MKTEIAKVLGSRINNERFDIDAENTGYGFQELAIVTPYYAWFRTMSLCKDDGGKA